VKRLKGWLEDLHAIFINYVKSQRSDKLADNPDLFTGEVFIGQKAIDQGLVDGMDHLVPHMKAKFGDKVRFRKFGQRKSILQRFGANIASDALGAVEDRAAFARFGL